MRSLDLRKLALTALMLVGAASACGRSSGGSASSGGGSASSGGGAASSGGGAASSGGGAASSGGGAASSGGGSASSGGGSASSGGGAASSGGGAASSGGGAASSGGGAASSGGGTAGGKRIFVTATTYSGKLLGLAGADQKCNTSAQAAVLGGTWKAWLSDSSIDALSRINDVGPWFDLTGAKVFNNKANLGTVPLVGVTITETRSKVVNTPIVTWTGTNPGGTKGSWTCSDWTSEGNTGVAADQGVSGAAEATNSDWTSFLTLDCYHDARLICLEQ